MTAPNDERIKVLKVYIEDAFGDWGKDRSRVARVKADLLSLLDAFPAMREELEKVKGWLERKESAKREVERQLEDCWIERKKAEAELTAARPLIEAVMGAEIMSGTTLAPDTGHFTRETKLFIGTGKVAILRAALALRQRKEKGDPK